jgi:hypothetical protein
VEQRRRQTGVIRRRAAASREKYAARFKYSCTVLTESDNSCDLPLFELQFAAKA